MCVCVFPAAMDVICSVVLRRLPVMFVFPHCPPPPLSSDLANISCKGAQWVKPRASRISESLS